MEINAYLLFGIGFFAFIYSSVGHGGASGYIAILSLANYLPEQIRPSALIMNIVVSSIASYNFWRAGYFSWNQFWPFAVLSIPFAFVGSNLILETKHFRILMGIILLISAFRIFSSPMSETLPVIKPKKLIAITSGGIIGLLSGLTGTGGGIFLTPLLYFNKWGTIQSISATTAFFILCNSLSGLFGSLSRASSHSSNLIWMSITALIFGFLGSRCGSKFYPVFLSKIAIFIVLIAASIKLLLLI